MLCNESNVGQNEIGTNAQVYEGTQLVGNEESMLDGTYVLGQSLPPHQMIREENDESELFIPNLTRQNSAVSSISDKVPNIIIDCVRLIAFSGFVQKFG